MFFHDRDVLVSRRMIEDRRFETSEQLRNSGLVLNAPDFGKERDLGIQFFHLSVQMEQSALRYVVADDRVRAKLGYLPAQFRAYRTARPSHDDRLTLQFRPYLRVFQMNRPTPQKIFHSNLTNLTRQSTSANHLRQGRHGLEPHSRRMTVDEDFRHLRSRR